MKRKLSWKIVSLILVLATLMTSLPLTVFAEEINNGGSAEQELYIKEVKLVQAKNREEAANLLALNGYQMLDYNLNEGTGKDGIWLGYISTTDPTEAIYDLKLMNMDGGFTRTSMEKALESQKSALSEMAVDLEYLMDEFAEAYEAGSEPAKSAYRALNVFRVVDGETELLEENGLGYKIAHGEITLTNITEILLFCDPTFVDTIVKLLVMGIQTRNGNWLQKLSEAGPYDEDTEYMKDEEELERRAEQLLNVIQLYSGIYNAMVKSGLMPDDFDENFNPVYKDNGAEGDSTLTAEEADLQKVDESRYKFYKIAADELAKYSYGTEGETLKDLFVSLEEEYNTKVLYPMVSVLSDAEFSALSYGCFLEMVTGADATEATFESYDEVLDIITEEKSSVYLYLGVDKALFDDEAIIGFTDTAQRHMAATGELEFFERENTDERVWGEATRVISVMGASFLAVMGLSKIGVGVLTWATGMSVATAATSTGAMAATIKYGAMLGGLKGLIVAVVVVVLCLVISYIVAVVKDAYEDKIDWENNPMMEYMYDVKEATFEQTSDDGVSTGFMTRQVYAIYEAVTDIYGELIDLNVRSGDASQWIQMFASYDRQGTNAKPIKCEDLLVKYGNGEAPEGYTPLTRFGEVVAYNLNQWDEEDDVNGVYVFYKQDKDVVVNSGVTYYISEVQLQAGESDAHCIELLKNAGYTPLNKNLSPDLTDNDLLFKDKIYTYIGYKVTTNAGDAIRDIRFVYGPSQGNLQYGAATYAACGSNGQVTLYATKYSISGTPILAGSLICVDEKTSVAAGYEPVCLMSGGSAMPINVDNKCEVRETYGYLCLYFLPETTFISGKQYLGGLAFFHGGVGHNDAKADGSSFPQFVKEIMWGNYVPAIRGKDGDIYESYVGTVKYYITYNPYRAIYGVKGGRINNYPNSLVVDGLPYYIWNQIGCGLHWVDNEYIFTIGISRDTDNAAFYLTGNPDVENVYNAETFEMSKIQPMEISDILISSGGFKIPDGFYHVVDSFRSSDNGLPLVYHTWPMDLVIYTKAKNEEKPYVSNILAVDQFSLYRAYGGAESGISVDQITEDMLDIALINQGATDLCYTTGMLKTHFWYSFIEILDTMNLTSFGITKTSKKSEGLTDVFFYFNGFSADEPPKTLYRGSVKYTLLCEIPYNLLTDEDMPRPGVYLYGTTNTAAGNKITDVSISRYPFIEGYETVRTMDGRSLMSEIKDYALYHKDANPMSNADDFYDALYKFFNNDEKINQLPYYYIHIKREVVKTENNTTEGGGTTNANNVIDGNLYIEKLYLASANRDQATAWESLFDQGADGLVNINLNDGAGGDIIYVGSSYTSDPAKAIKGIRLYHKKNPPSTLTDEDGRIYTLASDLNLNHKAGGDQIYLYTTTGLEGDDPIYGIDVKFEIASGTSTETWVDGSEVTMTFHSAMQWNSTKISNLNEDAGGKKLYLLYTTVDSDLAVPEKTPNYGNAPLHTREEYEYQAKNGKYIGGIYVMDKETIRLEKIANGTLPASATCKDVTDEEVFARLTAMGATTIIQTPINVSASGYFKNNANKVYIGYSRTNKSGYAIRNLAIKAEIMSLDEPKETISIKSKGYTLVAEAASEVTELPRAINLIGVEGGQDLNLPRLYLYYSTDTGSDPIYDISIDNLPLVNGWNTVRSANVMDPFADIYQQASAMKKSIDDDDLLGTYEQVYEDELSSWLGEIADLFKPKDAKAKPFYIHVKRYTEETIEEVKPYIGKIYLALGDSKEDALSQLIAYEPDGFVEVNFNQNAGGKKIYMAYKRVAKARDALTDVVIYQDKNFEPTRRIIVGKEKVKYTLVAAINLNDGSGGKAMCLYTTDSKHTGNPITDVDIRKSKDVIVKCGVETIPARRADGNSYTDEYINLNKSGGGDTIYFIMERETTEGHSFDINNYKEEEFIDATCSEDGAWICYYDCTECGNTAEKVREVYPATGEHYDSEDDGNHECDECMEVIVGKCTAKAYSEEDPDNPGEFITVYRCSECGAEMDQSDALASLFGNGSLIAILSLSGVAILAAILIFIKKRRTTVTTNKGDMEDEENI